MPEVAQFWPGSDLVELREWDAWDSFAAPPPLRGGDYHSIGMIELIKLFIFWFEKNDSDREKSTEVNINSTWISSKVLTKTNKKVPNRKPSYIDSVAVVD